ncbi:response regulator [Puia sp. P3]|uniref:response regulator n=1 Tax=Puia sp. P3 TaxID=3423952 RepID=UPI003D67417F
MSDKGKTLLIIDDSPFIITGLLHQPEGLPSLQKVYTAENYADAQPILQSSRPDVLLLDIHLPDVNGIEVLRRVKQLYPSVVVIMISNQEGDVYRTRCKALGAAHYIDKSTEFHLVSQIVSSFL